MAVGKQNRIFPGKSYTVKLKLKDGATFLETPEWEFQTAPDYEPLTPEQIQATFGVEAPIRDVEGVFTGLDARITSFEDKPIHNVTLFLEDTSNEDETKHELYRVQFKANNNLGRSLANTVLNLQPGKQTLIGLYSQLNKALGKTFAACSIRQGGANETVKWKMDSKTVAELQPRVFEGVGGKPTKDWTKVDEFLLSELVKFGESLKANRPKQEAAPVQEAPKEAPQTVTPETAAPASTEEQEGEPPF